MTSHGNKEVYISQFRWISTKVIHTENNEGGYISTLSQGLKKSFKCRTNSPTDPFLQLIQHIQVLTRSIGPEMITIFHARPCGRSIESDCRKKNFHRRNQGSNFLRGSFTNINSLRALIQFRRESESQCLK